MRGWGERKHIGKLWVPALIALLMVIGAWGIAVVPIAPPATTGAGGSTLPPSTRSGELPSLLGADVGVDGEDGASPNGVTWDSVSQGVIVNEDALGQSGLQPEPQAMGYDATSGRAWDTLGRPLDIDPAYLPEDSSIAFTSRSVGPDVQGTGPTPMAGALDAGGPYGGENTFEGDELEFTVIVLDPDPFGNGSLSFFRWDFNNDGVWDTGDEASGYWVSDLTVKHRYYDDYYDVVVVEAWDGVSIFSVRYTGWSLGSPSPSWYLYYFYYWTLGYKFKALQTMTIDELGFYRYSSAAWYGYEATVWDAVSQAKLGECNPSSGRAWRRCTLTSPITLDAGEEYVISMRLGRSNFGFYYARGVDTPSDTDQVEFGGMYYALFTPSPAFPGTFWRDDIIPLVEFYYDYAVVFPITETDNADVTVNNVAPIVYDLMTDPSSLLEGNPAEFSAIFNDPGLDDQWQFRWCYGDGTCDDWAGIRVGSGLSQLSNILVYSDVAPHYATQALDFFGVNYEFTSSIFTLPALITSKQWDLIIYQSYYIAYVAPIIEDEMMNQLAGGALVMYNNWYAFSRQAHPILEYFGGQWQSDLFSPLKMYAWEPGSDLFNVPLQPPLEFNPTHNQYFRDGQKIKVLSNAFDPMGYTQNRQTSEAAMVVRNDLTTIWNGFTPQNYQGDADADGDTDMLELLVNEIRLMTGPEVPRSMPWPVPTVSHVYRDDDPVTGTPSDLFDAVLEVQDDDHGRLLGGSVESLTEFESGSPWPAGWQETVGWAWSRGYSGYLASYSALYWYFYDWSSSTHSLRGPSWDLSGMDMSADVLQVTLTFDHSWQANWPAPWSFQDGYVEVSTDSFATYDVIAEFHHNDPGREDATKEYDVTSFAAGASNFQVRFTVSGYDDWWWHIDNVDLFAEWGTPIEGLGTGSATVEVNNVEPTIYGGAMSGLTGEAIPFLFEDYLVNDPTLWDPATGEWDPVPTEWFAYRWDFDDGVVSDWVHKGSLELPKLKVLVLHTLSFGTGSAFLNLVSGVDIVDQMDEVDFLSISPSAVPSVSEMMDYDLIIFATNYGSFSSTFELTRRTIGNRLADYLDLGGGGVITFMATYDNSPFYGELFGLLGRYIDEDYGAFEKTNYPFGAAALGEVYLPEHAVMQGVNRLTSPLIHSGDYSLTSGGVLLADWEDGNSAIGVKELANGARSVNIGSFSGSGSNVCGGDCDVLIRNSMVWAGKVVVKNNEIVPLYHTFGDNGLYSVDLQVIDDDMGWVWDSNANAPVAMPGATPTMSHTVIPVDIENRDPVLDTSSLEVFIAAQICLRVSGKEWNSVHLTVSTDGTATSSVTVQRRTGSPNDQAKCAFAKVDLTEAHTFAAEVVFEPMQGATSGSNPTWVIVEPWREPINPGHGTLVYKEDFNVGDDPATFVRDIDLGTLKQDLLDSGRGARIEFALSAWEAGSDDLAFVWMWGDGSPDTVNVHNNVDAAVTTGQIGDPHYLGFSEPYFDRTANSVRSPDGTVDFMVRDTVTHAYTGTGRFFWVVVIVLDDDNSRGYPSPFMHDGIDMEFIEVDLS